MKQKLAIVGTGISGMICAYYLRDDYDITLFDKNDYPGGHTHTHIIEEKGKKFTLDTGFIVFNLHTYPTLLNLFKDLDVKKRKSNMSFAVYNHENGLQYSGSSIKHLFSQKKNILSLRHWKFLFEIKKFFKISLRDYNKISKTDETIRSYCKRNNLSDYFVDNYLAPMSSAVWSTSNDDVYEFPIALLLPFFFNHGLLDVNRNFQWYTVLGGSNQYTKKILDSSKFDLHLKEEVKSVEEKDGKVKLKTIKKTYDFDLVILASHSDESLKIAKSLKKDKKELLSAFKYTKNIAVLHTDSSIMPPIKKVWSSWNHIISKKKNEKSVASTVYWLNMLQNPELKTDYFVSINPFQKINKDKIIKTLEYDHPLFTVENFKLQEKLHELNKNTKVYFAGAYFYNGFHEDGARSGLDVVKILKKKAKK